MHSVERFKYLGHAYFHQDYKEEHGSPTETVQAFAMENPIDTVCLLRDELSERLNAGLTEGGARQIWLTDVDAMYDPGRDGVTYVGWLRTVEHLLSVAADQRTASSAV